MTKFCFFCYRKSFEEIYNAALHNFDLGSKLVSLLSSHTFVKQYIHDFNFRYKFLKRLQEDFESKQQYIKIFCLRCINNFLLQIEFN